MTGVCVISLKRPCLISCQNLSTSKMYRQGTESGFETCHRLSMALLSTLGQKLNNCDQSLSNRLSGSRATKIRDDKT